MRAMRTWILLLSTALFVACAHAPPPRPAPPLIVAPDKVSELMQTPDAVPKLEPKSILGNPPFYRVAGRRYVVLASAQGFVERGMASWYGPDFHGNRTAIGEPYDMYAMTAAHKTLPIPCYARVTNLGNGKSVVVRINDRGPFVGNRIIDLSYTAALKLDMIRTGTALVQIETLAPSGPGPVAPPSPLVPTLPTPLTADGSGSAAPDAATASAAGAESAAAPLAAPSATATASAGTPPSGSAIQPVQPLFIQVGAYASGENARRTAQKLRAAGLTQVFTLLPATGQSLARVRIGPIADMQQFDMLIARLVKLGFTGSRLAQD